MPLHRPTPGFLKAAGAGLRRRRWRRGRAADASNRPMLSSPPHISKRDGAYGVGVLSEAGKLLFTSPLPDRGHDVTFDPTPRRSVVFARRPGTFAVVFDHAGKASR